MTHTLLLLFDSPMQSCGSESYFDEHKTAREPTFSEIIGILRAALGRTREDDFSDLLKLHIGTRTDQPGHVTMDYQIAQEASTYGGKSGPSHVIQKYYMKNAVFLVGIESDDLDFLELLEEKLLDPEFSLYLGRKSCPVTRSLVLGIKDGGLEAALTHEPWHAKESEQKRHKTEKAVPLELVMDTFGQKETSQRKDFPLSSTYEVRSFGYRPVVEKTVYVPNPWYEGQPKEELDNTATDQDPFSLV